MNKIENIDQPTIRLIRQQLEPVINKFLQDNYELKGFIGNASYTNKSITFKLEIKAEGVSDLAIQTARLHDWPEIGTEFKYNGRNFKVIDYALKKRSKPIVVTDLAIEDSRYVMTAEAVKAFATATK